MVAPRALDLSMGTAEREAGAVVIDSFDVHAIEGAFVVAVVAAGAEATGVRVFVAARAAVGRAEEGAMATVIAAVVALPALLSPVCAVQGPAGQGMVETFPAAAGPADEGCASADVFDVAFAAGPPPVLSPVQTLTSANARAEVFVAVEAAAG